MSVIEKKISLSTSFTKKNIRNVRLVKINNSTDNLIEVSFDKKKVESIIPPQTTIIMDEQSWRPYMLPDMYLRAANKCTIDIYLIRKDDE